MTAAVPDRPPEQEYGGPYELQTAWQLIAGGAPDAVRTLRRISTDGSTETAQVAASIALLKMGGFGRDEVQVHLMPPQFNQAVGAAEGHVSPAKIIEDRFAVFQQNAYDPDVDSGEIVEAEIVEDG